MLIFFFLLPFLPPSFFSSIICFDFSLKASRIFDAQPCRHISSFCILPFLQSVSNVFCFLTVSGVKTFSQINVIPVFSFQRERTFNFHVFFYVWLVITCNSRSFIPFWYFFRARYNKQFVLLITRYNKWFLLSFFISHAIIWFMV